QYQIGIVRDVATGRAQVENVLSGRTDFRVSVDVGHDIVAQSAFVRMGAGKVDVVQMGAHSLKLCGADAWPHAVVREHTQLVLSFGERQPEAAPSAELPLRSP